MPELFKCFVVMKFGQPFDSIYADGIAPVANMNFDNNSVAFLRADINLATLNLLGSIRENIAAADFVLADISPYDTQSGNQTIRVRFNPNVYYEIGYAKALGKPLIVISHGEQHRPPVDLSDCPILSYRWTPGDAAHLTCILTAAVSKAILEVEAQRRIIKSPYLVQCYSDRISAGIEKSIVAAQREILILQTNLETLQKYYLSYVKEAIETVRRSDDPLTVRILTLDPDSLFAASRAQQLSKNVADHRRNLHDNIRKVITEIRDYPEVELRVYDEFPNQIFFMADDDIFFCTLAKHWLSRELCTFKTNARNPGSERSFVQHFTALWGDASTYKGYLVD